jgi:hypothetical protein
MLRRRGRRILGRRRRGLLMRMGRIVRRKLRSGIGTVMRRKTEMVEKGESNI